MRCIERTRNISLAARMENLTPTLIPSRLNRRTKIDLRFLPINHRLREEIGSHYVGNLLSMNTQPLIKSFQMLHRGKSHLEQRTVAPTEFMHLQDLWKPFSTTGLKQTSLRKTA